MSYEGRQWFEVEDEDIDLVLAYIEWPDEVQEEEHRRNCAIAACNDPGGKYLVYMPPVPRVRCSTYEEPEDYIPF